MWVVVNISGKQEICRINQLLDIDYIKGRSLDIVVLGRLLFLCDNLNNIKIGKPLIKEKLQAILIQHFFGKKLLILRFKRKKHYKKIKGFRPKKTRILIKNIL